MFDELETIRIAAQLLTVRDPGRADALLRASDQIWERIYTVGNWPASLQEKARVLATKLRSRGAIDALVDALNEQQTNAICNEIVQFSAETEACQKVLV